MRILSCFFVRDSEAPRARALTVRILEKKIEIIQKKLKKRFLTLFLPLFFCRILGYSATFFDVVNILWGLPFSTHQRLSLGVPPHFDLAGSKYVFNLVRK